MTYANVWADRRSMMRLIFLGIIYLTPAHNYAILLLLVEKKPINIRRNDEK